MANILDKFQSTSVGSSGSLLDFTGKISPSGDYTKIYDLDVILLSWLNILTTLKGTCDHDPEFGSNLYLFIFDPADSETQDAIKEEIMISLMTYDDRASIENV